MSEKYDRQDGAPTTRPDSAETVEDDKNARPATIGDRSTEEGVAGQGLGQIKDGDIKHRAPGSKN